jgi:non-lysosomal glucosylceramidase
MPTRSRAQSGPPQPASAISAISKAVDVASQTNVPLVRTGAQFMKLTRRSLFVTAAAAAAARANTDSLETALPLMPGRRFSGEALREIAFPVGGIGTGTISLGGYGQLRDWEIFGRPAKGSRNPFTFASMRLAGGGLKRPIIRVLERQPLPPFNFPHGVPRETGLGLPRFRKAVFVGAYPFAQLHLSDARVPVKVTLEAFNPMIPLDTSASSLPVAVLEYTLASRADSPLDVAVAFSIMNPIGAAALSLQGGRRGPHFGGNLNEFRREQGVAGIFMSSRNLLPPSPRYGTLALLTRDGDLSYRLRWEHGSWWDEFHKWWDEFLEKGRFPNNTAPPSENGYTEYATLATHFTLEPGESRKVTFVLAWHFPNVEINWTNDEKLRGLVLKNHYGTLWPSAWEPARYMLDHYDSLRRRSEAYRDSLYGSTLPPAVLDAVSSQASIIRTPTVMVLEGNKTLAFEGCNNDSGCCPMNCTHVYNYAQAMAFLFPELERSMREIDFLVNMREDGSMGFRTAVPLEKGGRVPFPAADGQMGCVMKVYREWQLSGDDAWLRKLWPEVKRALEYAWKNWDADRDGVMEGEQHNTYDIEFYGPNTMMGTLYLGALTAAARMARHLGDTDAAAQYEQLARAGSARLDQLLWNGEYYVQQIDTSNPKAARYQYGDGCLSDQLLGQWFAEVVGLGKLLPAEHIRQALASIFRYNFREHFEDFPNAQRLYALNDDKGLLLCSWPRGGRPALPFVYSDEVWSGIEYQVAAHLIYEGMLKEGLTIVRAVRDRHDGIRRNPWNEFECGNHYARAMASWSLLTALSGFHYSAPRREIAFRPRYRQAAFRCLFCAGSAWGTYRQEVTPGVHRTVLEVAEGHIELVRLRVPFSRSQARLQASAPAELHLTPGEAVIEFSPRLRLEGGQKLEVSLQY